MSDPLASWFVHTVQVKRAQPDNAYGDTYAEPETVHGFYSDKTEYSNGEIVAAGRFAFGLEVNYIPVESLVTLPAQFGGRDVKVVSVAVGDSGGLPLPAHQVIGVL